MFVVAGTEKLQVGIFSFLCRLHLSASSYNGLSTIVVKPPAAAALVIDEKSSRSVPEQMLTFASIKPGMITFFPKS